MKMKSEAYRLLKTCCPFYYIETLDYNCESINIKEYKIIYVVDITRRHLILEDGTQKTMIHLPAVFNTGLEAQEFAYKIIAKYYQKNFQRISEKYQLLQAFSEEHPEYLI